MLLAHLENVFAPNISFASMGLDWPGKSVVLKQYDSDSFDLSFAESDEARAALALALLAKPRKTQFESI